MVGGILEQTKAELENAWRLVDIFAARHGEEDSGAFHPDSEATKPEG